MPHDAAGKSFTIKLRIHSKASAQSVDYEQTLMTYTGLPNWVRTELPDVQIADRDNLEIPVSTYARDDISGDRFTYTLDEFHSPRWVSIGAKNGDTILKINPGAITTNEAGTVQTVRVLATSQITHKTSAQLLTINVKANPALPKPLWRSMPLPIATVGVAHVVDLNQYIRGSTPDDHLTIKLGAGSPTWLSITNNRLTGIPPSDQAGGDYLVQFMVYSQASNTNTVISSPIQVQIVVAAGDNMESHAFYGNHQSIVIRGLEKNHRYHLVAVKGSYFDYGPFYSPSAIKTGEDWDNNPFYAVGNDKIIQTGDDGIVSLVYYNLPGSPPPTFDIVILR